jgi:organic hydroperoxide reductase OsmC/OhrA
MPEYSIHLKWSRDTPDFDYSSYTRTHTVSFGTNGKIFGSAAQEFHGDPQFLDPEQAFVMSLSSCHLLTFLALASKRGFTVDIYTDQALGEMGKNKAGKLAMLRVILRPIVVFSGDKKPSEDEFHVLHQRAKGSCIIANSIASCVELTTEPRMVYR